ncbi:hypothetical protein Hanom_Chr11g01002021 [Helianthus anomalus]
MIKQDLHSNKMYLFCPSGLLHDEPKYIGISTTLEVTFRLDFSYSHLPANL